MTGPSVPPRSAPPRTQVEAITARLRDAVLTGEQPPGHRLREVELAAAFDVSRHTLRAALRALAGEGLVVIEPHRGARVTRLDDDDLQALFELRTALEVEAVRLLRERHGFDPWPTIVEEAAAALQRACFRAGGAPDQTAIDVAHGTLHHALVRAADSPRITAAHEALTRESRLVLVQSRAALPPQRMASLHAALLNDLRSNGPDALRDHLHGGAAAAATPQERAPAPPEEPPDPR